MATNMHSRLLDHLPRVLTEYEAGRRNRRAVDAVLLGAMALLTGVAERSRTLLQTRTRPSDRRWSPCSGGRDNLCRAAVICALALSAVILVVIVVRRRWALLRDVVLALVVLGGDGQRRRPHRRP